MVISDELEKLTKHVQALTAQIKEKQSALKSITEEVKIAEADAAARIQEAEANAAQRLVDLREMVGPLEEEVRQLKLQRQAHLAEHQRYLDEHQSTVRSLKSEKLACLADLDNQCADKMNRLVSMQQAIEDCKQRVAAL